MSHGYEFVSSLSQAVGPNWLAAVPAVFVLVVVLFFFVGASLWQGWSGR